MLHVHVRVYKGVTCALAHSGPPALRLCTTVLPTSACELVRGHAYREEKERDGSNELAPQGFRMAHEAEAHGHRYLRENCEGVSR